MALFPLLDHGSRCPSDMARRFFDDDFGGSLLDGELFDPSFYHRRHYAHPRHHRQTSGSWLCATSEGKRKRERGGHAAGQKKKTFPPPLEHRGGVGTSRNAGQDDGGWSSGQGGASPKVLIAAVVVLLLFVVLMFLLLTGSGSKKTTTEAPVTIPACDYFVYTDVFVYKDTVYGHDDPVSYVIFLEMAKKYRDDLDYRGYPETTNSSLKLQHYGISFAADSLLDLDIWLVKVDFTNLYKNYGILTAGLASYQRGDVSSDSYLIQLKSIMKWEA
ncbi:hypothetical protein HPB49_018738 [Dermacentor silvarum]|uniref:Uncharacterized protein n=1 Tax=Dermacentor silvarum TaxID=543639 RepID=A0ACB8DK67_DERSI|nr:hypothetical protein HPB49_018738 [Dermacentor silvarum]